MLQHLENEWVLLFYLPHLVEEIRRRRPRAVRPFTSNTASHMRGDAVSQRQLDVMRKIAKRAQFENIECRSVFVIGMCRRVEPRMSNVVAQTEHEGFTPFSNHLGIEGKGFELRDEVGKGWLKQRTAGTVLRDDVLVHLSDN